MSVVRERLRRWQAPGGARKLIVCVGVLFAASRLTCNKRVASKAVRLNLPLTGWQTIIVSVTADTNCEPSTKGKINVRMGVRA